MLSSKQKQYSFPNIYKELQYTTVGQVIIDRTGLYWNYILALIPEWI